MAQPSCMGLALTLPEILVNVFELLESHAPSLVAAIRVNKQWFACGTDVLWREPPLEALADVKEDRRQVYAAKIRALSFFGGDDNAYHARFQHLQFSSLRRVSLDVYRRDEGGGYHIRQYIQPSLEEFLLYGSDLDDELLHHVQNTCRRLQRILMDSPGQRVTASSFFNFISGCNSLKHMEFECGMDHLLTDELLLHLAHRASLSSLAIGKACSKQVLEQISTHISEPFKELQTLHMPVPSSAVPLLVELVKHATSLDLAVRDADIPVTRIISAKADLHALSLSFAVPTELSRNDILSLQALSRLERLSIGPEDMYDAAVVTAFSSGFSDSDFDELCSKLPFLRRIEFKVQCNLSAAALESLSTHCPLLEECTMPQVVDLQALSLDARQAVMFPHLRLLELGGLQPPEVGDEQAPRHSPEETASLIKRLFPKLEELCLISDDEYSNGVLDAFSALEGSSA
ncbi:Uncharacterized protein TPAR_07313 [Tolypocladium paradoxum]|uniref:F-box domain-containing protein n=1 Tax=Tolypocladium paradoxum TaxID=94208 RepID=A0A2S4KQK7_9HYPO|nr:Uncharacterized protein TPAR_07313 [Tolypocladium paradoxum]